jgi:cholesterol transport system auxiliary component
MSPERMKRMGVIAMERRALLGGAAALVLSGCSSDLIGPPPAGRIYTLNPSFATGGTGEKVDWALAIDRPEVPGGLDGDRIALYQPGGVQDFYADATWPDRLPALVQRALLDGFEASGRIAAVSREQDALHTDYALMTEVKDFSARYAARDGIPTVTVTIMAKLVAAHGRRIVGSLTASHSEAAGANSVAAVAQALTEQLRRAVLDIVGWALAQPAPAPEMPQETPGR